MWGEVFCCIYNISVVHVETTSCALAATADVGPGCPASGASDGAPEQHPRHCPTQWQTVMDSAVVVMLHCCHFDRSQQTRVQGAGGCGCGGGAALKPTLQMSCMHQCRHKRSAALFTIWLHAAATCSLYLQPIWTHDFARPQCGWSMPLNRFRSTFCLIYI